MKDATKDLFMGGTDILISKKKRVIREERAITGMKVRRENIEIGIKRVKEFTSMERENKSRGAKDNKKGVSHTNTMKGTVFKSGKREGIFNREGG